MWCRLVSQLLCQQDALPALLGRLLVPLTASVGGECTGHMHKLQASAKLLQQERAEKATLAAQATSQVVECQQMQQQAHSQTVKALGVVGGMYAGIFKVCIYFPLSMGS